MTLILSLQTVKTHLKTKNSEWEPWFCVRTRLNYRCVGALEGVLSILGHKFEAGAGLKQY